MKVNTKEVLRYLGCRDRNSELENKIEEMGERLMKVAEPKTVHIKLPIEVSEDGITVGGIFFKSRDIVKNLTGCRFAVLFAATVGAGVDRMVRQLTAIDIGNGAVANSAAASLVESLCDELEEKIAAENQGLYLRPRYSPGYGDFPLESQSDFLSLIDAQRRVGITLTDGNLMLPEKSVTAIIGLSDTPCRKASKCLSCNKNDCPFREE